MFAYFYWGMPMISNNVSIAKIEQINAPEGENMDEIFYL